jgi:hypothetical protein
MSDLLGIAAIGGRGGVGQLRSFTWPVRTVLGLPFDRDFGAIRLKLHAHAQIARPANAYLDEGFLAMLASNDRIVLRDVTLDSWAGSNARASRSLLMGQRARSLVRQRFGQQ